MRRHLLPAILLLCLLPLGLSGRDASPSVLILHSYHPDMIWESDIRKTISAALRKRYHQPRIYLEFMDTKHHTGQSYLQSFRLLLTQKYRNRKLNAIIAIDDAAYRFLLRYRDGILGPVPVVFCGVNFYDPAQTVRTHGYTGVVESIDIAGTLSLIRRLQPDLDELIIINDGTLTGIQNRRIIDSLKATSPITLVSLPKMAINTLRTRLRSLTKKQAVLLLSFTRDATGNTFTYRESIRIIRSVAPVPVYGVWDFFLNRGIIGGRITSGKEHGQQASSLLFRILAGTPADKIPVITKSATTAIVDYREAARFGLDTSNLPQNTVLINRPSSLLSLSRSTILLLIALITAGAGLSLILSFRLRKQKQHGKRMETSGRNYRLLSRKLEKKVTERTKLLLQSNEELRCSLDELEQEANAARRIQFQLLPNNEKTVNGVHFQHLLLPSKFVSGDFVDYFQIDAHRIGFFTADVAGHGLSAAFITIFLKGEMDLQLEKYQLGTGKIILRPELFLGILNDTIIQYDLGKHIALFYGIVNLKDRVLTCSNAGIYPFPILIQNGRTTVLDMKSPPLGLFSGSHYYARNFDLDPDFRLTVFSDGVLEILPDQPLLKKERCLQEIVEQGDGSLLYFSNRLKLEEKNSLADDITILTVRGNKTGTTPQPNTENTE